MRNPRVTSVRFHAACRMDQLDGLLGWASAVVGDTLLINGFTVRRTRGGALRMERTPCRLGSMGAPGQAIKGRAACPDDGRRIRRDAKSRACERPGLATRTRGGCLVPTLNAEGITSTPHGDLRVRDDRRNALQLCY
jgi:hypothetical protein